MTLQDLIAMRLTDASQLSGDRVRATCAECRSAVVIDVGDERIPAGRRVICLQCAARSISQETSPDRFADVFAVSSDDAWREFEPYLDRIVELKETGIGLSEGDVELIRGVLCLAAAEIQGRKSDRERGSHVAG